MREVILLVGHGSRDVAGNEEVEQFAAQWRSQQSAWDIQVCFIEFADMTLMPGLERAAISAQAKPGQDQARVLVLPLILNAAGHVKMDIPEAIAHARLHHPEVRFDYAPHLGSSGAILQILRRCLRKAMLQLDAPDPKCTGVIVLGRGSSDPQANGEMARLTRCLYESSDHELVDLAFTGVTWPRLENVVQRHKLLGMQQVVILPHYLFTGTLVKRIARQTEHLQKQYPHMRFVHSRYFGFEPEIFALLNARVLALRHHAPAARMPCDGCSSRETAALSGEFEHHHDEAAPQHDHPPHHPQAHAAAVHTHPCDAALHDADYPPRFLPQQQASSTLTSLQVQVYCEGCKYLSFVTEPVAHAAHAPH